MTKPSDDALLLTVEQAAKLCQISRGRAYELVSRGELPPQVEEFLKLLAAISRRLTNDDRRHHDGRKNGGAP